MIIWINVAYFLISSIVLGLLYQLLIFWKLYLIELLEHVTGPGLEFDRIWHAGLLNKLKSHGILGWTFCLILSFLGNRQFWVVLKGKSSQEYWFNSAHRSIIGPTLFQVVLYINDLPDDVICNIAIYDDDTTPYSRCDQTCDLWQQLELASELESDLRDTVDWGRKWLVDLNAGKTQLISFDQPHNIGIIDKKMDGSVLKKNNFSRC